MDDGIKIQRDNLLELLQMIFLKGDCWHRKIEDMLCNHCEPPIVNYDKSNNGCPSCLDTMSDYIMLVIISGITNASGSLSPESLIKKLT